MTILVAFKTWHIAKAVVHSCQGAIAELGDINVFVFVLIKMKSQYLKSLYMSLYNGLRYCSALGQKESIV